MSRVLLSLLLVALVRAQYGEESTDDDKDKYQETKPQHGTEICRSDEESAIFYIDKESGVERDWSAGKRPYIPTSCKECSTGTQFNYNGLEFDKSISDVKPDSDDVIGGFYCKNSRDLCVELVGGKQYKGNSDHVLIYPVPYCQDGFCDALLLLSKGSVLKSTKDDHEYSYEHQIVEYTGKYIDVTEHKYLKVRGVSCNGCQGALTFCDSVDDRPIEEDDHDDNHTNEHNIEESGYEGDNNAYPAPQSPDNAVDNEKVDSYGMNN